MFSKRYFKNDEKDEESDIIGNTIVELLEKIIGKSEIENFYLNGNLHGLVDELKQYIDNDEYLIRKFIINVDVLYDLLRFKKKHIFFIRKIIKEIKEIFYFLSLCYLRKNLSI